MGFPGSAQPHPRTADLNGVMEATDRILDVLHVARAYSAEPTLSITLGDRVVVREKPLAEALHDEHEPDLIWITDPSAQDLRTLRHCFPTASMLVTRRGGATGDSTTALLGSGADLVLDDESVVCAAAGLDALARRPRL